MVCDSWVLHDNTDYISVYQVYKVMKFFCFVEEMLWMKTDEPSIQKEQNADGTQNKLGISSPAFYNAIGSIDFLLSLTILVFIWRLQNRVHNGELPNHIHMYGTGAIHVNAGATTTTTITTTTATTTNLNRTHTTVTTEAEGGDENNNNGDCDNGNNGNNSNSNSNSKNGNGAAKDNRNL
eukprot:jgi/Psemu1/33178/gm1.33178_g